MRDLIGKRNWFFAFSLALTIPGIIFILLGPLTGGKAGLQFSIDYTGGTKWEIRFEDRTVTPEQVKAVLVAEGFADSIVQTTSEDYLLIRTGATGFAEEPSPTPVPTASPAASGSPAASASAAPSAAPSASASPAPSATPAPSGSPAASASVAPSTSPARRPARPPRLGQRRAGLRARRPRRRRRGR